MALCFTKDPLSYLVNMVPVFSRMMERAGVGPRSARTLPWFEHERETYQHHAEYLQRLSKLREELIREEQSNLASALDRLKMRSYGKEYVYSRPKENTFTKRHSALPESPQRKALVTTLEKFQKMRPKKLPPKILPIEGKSLLEPPVSERIERQTAQTKPVSNRSVDESVRMNLQRLNGHTVASIPRGRKNMFRDMFVESSSMRKHVKPNDANNSSGQEDKIAQMHRQRQKAQRMKQEALRAEQARLAPQSFRLESANDEDRMNMESLKDYYTVYYIPAPSPAPEQIMTERSEFLPSIPSQQSCPHISSEISLKNGKGGAPLEVKYGQNRGYNRIGMDVPISPCTCNCTCRMFISGNKLQSPFGHVDPFNSQQTSFYNRFDTGTGNCSQVNGSNRNNSRDTESEEWSDTQQYTHSLVKSQNGNSLNGDKRQIVVDMPTIVFNTPSTPEPTSASALNVAGGGLVKAFKQKELRQKELSNLMEDVKELNKRTETLVNHSLE